MPLRRYAIKPLRLLKIIIIPYLRYNQIRRDSYSFKNQNMDRSGIRLLLIAALLILGTSLVKSQVTMPEELEKGTFVDQFGFIEERTRIYDNFRAIREDIFQKLKKNAVDTLRKVKNEVTGYVRLTSGLNHRIDSLKTALVNTKDELFEINRTKNSIGLFGIQVNKVTYNLIMWLVVAGLTSVLLFGLLAFKRNLSATRNTKKELRDLRQEFEEYRQKTRLEREKMSMDHFNELRKYRGA